MADDDLYGDLDISADALNIKSLEAELKSSRERCSELEEQMASMRKRDEALKEENEQLARNISCLFNTAKSEIDRKDRWIERLRRDLQAVEARHRHDTSRR